MPLGFLLPPVPFFGHTARSAWSVPPPLPLRSTPYRSQNDFPRPVESVLSDQTMPETQIVPHCSRTLQGHLQYTPHRGFSIGSRNMYDAKLSLRMSHQPGKLHHTIQRIVTGKSPPDFLNICSCFLIIHMNHRSSHQKRALVKEGALSLLYRSPINIHFINRSRCQIS